MLKKNISIVIPCRNEEKYIEKCIESIVNSNYPHENIQIIVCDGKSTDKTIDKLNNLSKKYNFINYIINEKQTTQYALNLGVNLSKKADFIMIIGSHSEISNNYLNKSIEILENNEIACVGGVVENVFENKISEIISKAMSSSFGVGLNNFRAQNYDSFVDTVGTPIYKKDIFDKIGLFDEELTRNQDDEFNFRVLKNGYKIFLSKDIHAKYYVRASFSKLYKQYYQYGYWKVYVNKKHKTITTLRQLIPFLFVVFLIVFSIGSLLSKIILYIYISILFLYLILAFYSASKKTKNIKEVFLVIYTFIILHVSYGYGYLQGIVDFFILRKKISNKNTSLSR
ncbi:MAG: glycosyltransferase family 2 protein [Candidatus Sericytochromatia bacterium]